MNKDQNANTNSRDEMTKDAAPRMEETTALHFTNEYLTDAAKSIFDIAIRWELGDGMTDENPVMKVAEEMLRQIRALRMQHYRNNHAGVSATASGVFALPPAIRHLFPKGEKDK